MMSMPGVTAAGIGTAGMAAAGVGVAAGTGLFSYNRGNYMMDQKLHFARYNAGLNLAIAQMKQYRQDLGDLTDLTCQRMDTYHTLAAMTATILTALFAPGRLGLHTPPPPQWLMGLFMINLAGCYLWLGLTMWLAMHASLRADTALTHMLTRFVRVPVPATWMIDRARKFLSSFEEQPLREVFRIPFTRHQRRNAPGEGRYNEGMDVDVDAQRRSRHGCDVPAWYRKEKAIDTGVPVESIMPYQARGTAPEHFEAFREIQNEWWPYDCYSRVCMFLMFTSLISAWTFHDLGHQLAETRSVFAAGCCVLPMFTLQQLILTLDIVPNKGEFPMNLIHRLGPCSFWTAYVAICMEYRMWFSQAGMYFSWVLVYLSYGLQIVWTIQMLRLATPDLSKPPPAAEAGNSWWPDSWQLPTSFQHALWMVAPPRHLLPGQHDLVGELRAEARQGASMARTGSLHAEVLSPAEEKRRDVHRALGKQGESPAWFNVKMGLLAMIVAWVFMVGGFTVEIINQGTMHPSFLSAFGLPNHLRDPRYRRPKPGKMEPVEVGTGGIHGPARGIHPDMTRRLEGIPSEPLQLAGEANSALREEIVDRLKELLPYLKDISGGNWESIFPTTHLPVEPSPSVALGLPSASMPLQAEVQWPPLFEPRLLACGPVGVHSSADGSVAMAFSRHGRGTLVNMPATTGPAKLTPFLLEGVAGAGPLAAAMWDEVGLLLTSATGTTMECPGRGPSQGRWHCRPLPGAKLPINLASRPFSGSIAIGRHPKQGLRAAVVYPGEPSITVFTRMDREAAPWLPAGEVRTGGFAAALSFAAEEAFLLSPHDGSVMGMRMDDGTMRAAAASIPGRDGHVWQATCGLPSGGIVRLALKPSGSAAMEPLLFLS